jgi:hypothetical protein
MKYPILVHYQPVENYPPVLNFLDYLVEKGFRPAVFTCRNNSGRSDYLKAGVSVRRYKLSQSKWSWIRLFYLFSFNIRVLANLFLMRPRKIIYFETYSCFPVYLYKKYFNRKLEVLIHFHECFSKEWYRRSMRVMPYYYEKERNFLYPGAIWISQTNRKRIELFKQDNDFIRDEVLHVLPNYPPKVWVGAKRQKKEVKIPVRTVYLGSLSLANTFLREYCEWVVRQKGRLKFDIYAYNVEQKTKEFLANLGSEWISFHSDGVEYARIPEVLKDYDVGVIFYKGLSPSVKYSAPNKLFEYLMCGLEVWFSKEVEGCHEFIHLESHPRVIMLDYLTLDDFDYASTVENHKLPERQLNYISEVTFQELMSYM